MKKCPFCAEEIQDEAIKCRHCKSWLEVKQQASGSTQDIGSKQSTIPGVSYLIAKEDRQGRVLQSWQVQHPMTTGTNMPTTSINPPESQSEPSKDIPVDDGKNNYQPDESIEAKSGNENANIMAQKKPSKVLCLILFIIISAVTSLIEGSGVIGMFAVLFTIFFIVGLIHNNFSKNKKSFSDVFLTVLIFALVIWGLAFVGLLYSKLKA